MENTEIKDQLKEAERELWEQQKYVISLRKEVSETTPVEIFHIDELVYQAINGTISVSEYCTNHNLSPFSVKGFKLSSTQLKKYKKQFFATLPKPLVQVVKGMLRGRKVGSMFYQIRNIRKMLGWMETHAVPMDEHQIVLESLKDYKTKFANQSDILRQISINNISDEILLVISRMVLDDMKLNKACKLLGVNERTVYNWKTRNPVLWEVMWLREQSIKDSLPPSFINHVQPKTINRCYIASNGVSYYDSITEGLIPLDVWRARGKPL